MYAVYCRVTPTKRNGLTKAMNTRVGPADTMNEVREVIRKDREAMNNTFSGLIDAPGDSGRTYHVFKSQGWDRVEI